jgi:hypothetical protein
MTISVLECHCTALSNLGVFMSPGTSMKGTLPPKGYSMNVKWPFTNTVLPLLPKALTILTKVPATSAPFRLFTPNLLTFVLASALVITPLWPLSVA